MNIIVVHSTLKDLAEGFIKTAKKEVKKTVDILVEFGRDRAVDFACTAIEARTGLPNNICRRGAEIVVDKLSKEVRDKLKK